MEQEKMIYRKERSSKGWGFCRVLLVLIAIILMIGVVATICNKALRKDYDHLSNLDKSMFDELNYVYESSLWDGYEVKPLILVKKGDVFNAKGDTINLIRLDAYAIGVEGLDGKWYAQKIEMPGKYSIPDVYRLSPLTPGLFDTWIPFGNFSHDDSNMSLGSSSNIFFMKYNSRNIDSASIDDEFISFLVHEGFHYIAQEGRPGGQPYSEITTDEQYQNLKNEYAALDRVIDIVIKNGDAEELNAAVKDFAEAVKVRDEEDHKALYQEKLHETLEGSAQYVEYLAYTKMVNQDVTVIFERYRDAVKELYGKDGFEGLLEYYKENGMYNELTWVRYQTGAFMCVLLDKMEVENWQTLINENPNLTLCDILLTRI